MYRFYLYSDRKDLLKVFYFEVSTRLLAISV